METEIEEVIIQSPRSLRIPRISSVCTRDSSSTSEINRDNNNLQYMSLKDIMCNTPTRCSALLYEGNDFDSNIAIRNELVKRAASVYLQSAALLVTRNQNCFVAFWERMKSKARLFGGSGNPFGACLYPILQFLNHMLGSLRSLP